MICMHNFQVVLSSTARDQIDRYIHAYAIFFDKLYEDTGIWSENQIREHYVRQAVERKEKILDKIQNAFSPDKILGRVSETVHVILFEQKVLIVTYSEDTVQKIRFIDDVIIADRR